jgi:peptidoglycan/xylan/chitin deacetylase (PgdA/CDA1 family)
MVRRAAFVLTLLAIALVIFSLVVTAPGNSSSRAAYVRPVSSVEASTFPELPDPSPPDLGQVWAEAGDRSPDLATRGKLATSGGKIALTFDDGPDPRVTPSILDTLKEHHVEATFFVVGRQVEEHPGLLRRIVEEGHTIGNHTYDHADLSRLSPEQMRSELQRTQKAVDEALGYHYQMALIRPPYGDPYFGGSNALPAFRRVMGQQQLLPVTWTVDSQDYLMDGYPEGIVRNVVREDDAGRRQNRDEVILMHDIHLQDAQALPGIIDHYDGSDRKFVGVDELVRDKYLGH